MSEPQADKGASSHARVTLPALLLIVIFMAPNAVLAGLGPDAAANLRAAYLLLKGEGLVQSAATPEGVAWFGTWPPGYPVLLALLKWPGLSPRDVLWLLPAAAVAASVAMLRRLRPDERDAAAAPLGFASVLHAFATPGSEAPFMVALLALAMVLATPSSPSWASTLRVSGLAATAALAAFSMRYIGVVAVPVLVGAAMVAWRQHDRRRAVGLLLATLPTLAAGGILGWLNLHHTGHLTGVERLPAPESWATWLIALARGVFVSAVPTVHVLSSSPMRLLALAVGLVVLAAGAVHIRRAPDLAWPSWTPHSRSLVAVGGSYLLLLVALRMVRHFDLFTTRLLAPATLLFLAAAVSAVGTLAPVARRRADAAFGAAAYAGMMSTMVLQVSEAPPWSKEAVVAAVSAYNKVPRRCVVGPHDNDLVLRRPDLIPAMPHAPPYQAEAESVEAFSARLLNTPWPCVRLDRRVPLDPRRYHPSWFDPADPHAGTLQVLR